MLLFAGDRGPHLESRQVINELVNPKEQYFDPATFTLNKLINSIRGLTNTKAVIAYCTKIHMNMCSEQYS
jgi:hypothetical protein